MLKCVFRIFGRYKYFGYPSNDESHHCIGLASIIISNVTAASVCVYFT